MEKGEYIFRAVNPRNDEDVEKYFKLKQKLTNFLNARTKVDQEIINWQRCHFGAPEYVWKEKFKDKILPPLEENADEFAFVCECDGEFVGYIEVLIYHLVDGKRPEDNVGTIHEIYIDKKHQGNQDLTFPLLQMGVSKLIEHGKTMAECEVQEDNENHYIHFALADGNVIDTSTCKRKNGTETTSFKLLIDLKQLKETTSGKLLKKIARYHKEMMKKEEDLNV